MIATRRHRRMSRKRKTRSMIKKKNRETINKKHATKGIKPRGKKTKIKPVQIFNKTKTTNREKVNTGVEKKNEKKE